MHRVELLDKIKKTIMECEVENNSEVFSSEEISELEDNLKGLGYI